MISIKRSPLCAVQPGHSAQTVSQWIHGLKPQLIKCEICTVQGRFNLESRCRKYISALSVCACKIIKIHQLRIRIFIEIDVTKQRIKKIHTHALTNFANTPQSRQHRAEKISAEIDTGCGRRWPWCLGKEPVCDGSVWPKFRPEIKSFVIFPFLRLVLTQLECGVRYPARMINMVTDDGSAESCCSCVCVFEGVHISCTVWAVSIWTGDSFHPFSSVEQQFE